MGRKQYPKQREKVSQDKHGHGSVPESPPKLITRGNKNKKHGLNNKNAGGSSHPLSSSSILLFIVIPAIVMSGVAYYYYQAQLRERVRTQLDVDTVIPPGGTSSKSDPERFWGSYRPNVYFGLKTRTARSPVTGLMWMTQFNGEPQIRHWCEHSDGIPMYGWFAHDGVNFGIQEILDKYYTVSTNFVKRPGGDHGGDWTAQVEVKPRQGAEQAVVSLFFYMALDGPGNLQAEVQKNRLTAIRGYTEELGDFRLVFPKSKEEGGKKKTAFNYLVTYASSLSELKEMMMEGFQMINWDKEKQYPYLGLGGTYMPGGKSVQEANFIVFQVTTNVPHGIQVQFESGSYHDRPNVLSGPVFLQEIQKHLHAFDDKFKETFKLHEQGFSDDEQGFAKAALSNMLGSIGYFYGSSLVKSKYVKEEPLQYWPAALYTAVPSRSFFPRGFLWDEGFHNILISKWNPEISKDIIGHWLDLMNIEGWIPREQILGAESRAKVPDEFVVQHNENANPPTLFLPLQHIIKDLIKSEVPADRNYLKRLFPRLQTWYRWFNVSQIGNEPFTYRWRGRDSNTKREINPKTLTSGLDDYPRASHPTEIERHLDLRCWMALASSVMFEIAQSLNDSSWTAYKSTYDLLMDNKLLNQLHWSEKAQQYSDWGLHSNHVKLEKPKPQNPSPGQRPMPPKEAQRVVKVEPKEKFVDSFGYVSLFPFLLKIVDPDSLKLGKVLKDLQDPNLLWTKYGLRSLAKNAPLYAKRNTEHDPPYWRGAIWMNMNYLALGALKHYSDTPGPYNATAQNAYKELRKNIINNMFTQYKTTGYIWEQYDDNTGKGKGTHPFTGWSALVVAIMAEYF